MRLILCGFNPIKIDTLRLIFKYVLYTTNYSLVAVAVAVAAVADNWF